MSHLHKVLTSAMFAVICLTLSVQAEDEKNPASQASEQTVPENVRGKTSDKGPSKVFGEEKTEKTEQKEEKAEKSEKAEKKEKKKEKKVKKEEVKEEKQSDAGSEEKAVACAMCKSADCAGCQKCAAKDNETACASKDCKACAHDDKHVHTGKKACASCDAKVVDKNAKCGNCGKKMSKCKCPPAVVEATEALNAVELARKKLELERRTSSAIRRLTTSGWREAYASLVEGGKDAVPFLIEAMGDNEKPAYQLGGHVKADAGRAPRQRTQAEVCCEVLTDIVKNRSNFRGEVPTVDQKAWQEWWTSNQTSVTFGN